METLHLYPALHSQYLKVRARVFLRPAQRFFKNLTPDIPMPDYLSCPAGTRLKRNWKKLEPGYSLSLAKRPALVQNG